ncbi:MAG: SusC/RagA family TonB-linked outer membrane protein [Bacteroidales bacterium]|nr:SusC/RagA family TonB-linked outer membrane protein [Bacteroidales bacterium]
MRKFTLLLALLVFIGMQVVNAQKTITGTVTSLDDGTTLPGVAVVVKGTTTGTITDVNGKYSLDVPEDATILVFKYVGMVTEEMEIGANKIIDLSMVLDIMGLDEVVVTAFGITREKKALGYSVQELDGDEFTKAREANMVNSLSGKVAGVNVTNTSGAVGSSSRITLRGASSITGNNQPLFIVDGVPIDDGNYGNADSYGGFDLPNGISDISPDDIESISVLKGPNAAALYGLRAANGVIVITTKSGKQQVAGQGVGITFNSSTSWENPLVLPSFQNSYGQGGSKDKFEWIDGTLGDGGVDESWGPPLDVGLSFTQWDSYKVNGAPLPWVSHPDNIKNFFETGLTTNNNLSFTGGTENISYRLSTGMMNQTGIIPNTDFTKYNISGKSSINFTEKLKAGFNVNYIKSESGNLPTGGYTGENPVQQMIWSGRNVDFEALKDYENLPLADPGTPAVGTPINWNTQFQNNPYWVLDNNLNKMKKDRLIGGFNLSYQIADYLSISGKTGIDHWSMITKEEKAVGTNIDDFRYGYYRQIARNRTEINSELLISFNKKFTEDIDFNLNFGGNRMYRKYDRLTGIAPQLELEGVYNLSNVRSGVPVTLTNFLEESKINSIYGFGQVSYKDAIFLDFTGRNDWASVLPIDNNSFFYPSVTLSALITEFVDIDPNMLTFLKVRGGWSKVGSTGALDPYDIQQTFSFRNPTNEPPNGGPWGTVLLPFTDLVLSNPTLKSETTTGIELGIDARFLSNRIRLDLTYFNQKSTDLLVPVEISAASGYIQAWDNVGEMVNKGFEIQLGITPVKTKDLKVDLDLNFYKNNNEVTSLGGLDALILGGQWNVDLQARVGEPWGVLFGPGYLKDDNGNIIHENGIAQVDDDYRILGNIAPDWRGGVTLNVSYKSFTFNTTIDAKMGGDVYSMTTTWGRYAGILEESLYGRETGIIGDGVMQIGTDANGDPIYGPNDVVVTAKAYNQSAYDNSVAEGSVFDASYIKLRQIIIGYDFPKEWFANLPIYRASFSLVGRNLAILFKNVPHIDPETSFSSENAQQGIEFGQLPSVRSYGFNININF